MTSLGLGLGDAAASARLCVPLFNNMLSAQKAQFNTRIITHPQKDKLGLCVEELRNNPLDAIEEKKRNWFSKL